MIKYRHNYIVATSPESFAQIRGGVHNGVRDVCFVRLLGRSTELDRQVVLMDQELNRRMQTGELYYRRIVSLPGLPAQEEIAYYTDCYEQWAGAPRTRKGIHTKGTDRTQAELLGTACA